MKRRTAKSFERTTIVPGDAFGLDSVQGYLELASWYHLGEVTFGCHTRDRTKLHSMYARLCQLEKEGHMLLEWAPRESSDGDEMVELRQVSLTTSGHKLLGELKSKSRLGRLKDRLGTIAWAAASSVVTTLVVLAVKGAS